MMETVTELLKQARQDMYRAKNAINATGYVTKKQEARLASAEKRIKDLIESDEYKEKIAQKKEKQHQRRLERNRRYYESNRENINQKNRARVAEYCKTDAYKEWRNRPEVRARINENKRKRRAAAREKAGFQPFLSIRIAAAAKRVEKAAQKAIIEMGRHEFELSFCGPPNPSKAMSKAELWKWRYKNDPAFNTRERIRNQIKKMAQKHPRLGCLIRDAINRDGESRTIHQVLGYSVRELKAHLEKQFTKGMTWDEFLKGNIHIDHIIPKSAFDLTEEEDISRCWAMSNLRPLWAKDNLSKGARIEHVI